MTEFDVRNRFSGKVQFTADIDCGEDASQSIKLGLAVRWAIKNKANLCSANLRSADLRSADLRYADLRSANLCSADLRSANLCYANLRSADLCSANLCYADLRSANLCSANLCYADLRSADFRLGNNKGDRVIFISHLGYFVLAYVVMRKGNLSMCLEIGCKGYTVQTFERKYKAGEFANEKEFIDVAMPYIEAIKKDLKKIKEDIEA